MVRFFAALFLFSHSFSLTAAETTYEVKWITDKLNIEVKTVRAMENVRNRISEKGIVKAGIDLPVKDPMKDGKLTLNDNEQAFLYALVKNVGKKTLRFSVAPHATTPGSSALGFKFNCLCNGHVYEVRPGEIWYRIMHLNNSGLPKSQTVKLEHVIFDVEKDGAKYQAHHQHGHHHH